MKDAIIIFSTAFATAVLSALFTYTYTIKSENQKNVTAIHLQFLTEFQKGFSDIISAYYKSVRPLMNGTDNINVDDKTDVLASILMLQISFHPDSGRWSTVSQIEAEEFFENLAKFRKSYQDAIGKSQINDLNSGVLSLLIARDKLVEAVKKNLQMKIDPWPF